MKRGERRTGLALILACLLGLGGGWSCSVWAQEAKGEKKAEAKTAAEAKPPAKTPAKPAQPKPSEDEVKPQSMGEDDAGLQIPDKLDPRIIGIIEQRRQQLLQEEDRLARQREELKKLQEEVNGRIDELKKVQAALEELVKVEQTQRADRLTQLVKTMTNMRPAAAAAVISKLDDQMAVDVFARLPSRAAGGIMAAMKPEHAARISELLTRNKEAQQAARIAEQAASQGAQPPPAAPKGQK